MENQGYGQPATATGYATTTNPKRDLHPGNPNMVGAAPREEKKGIADKVKGLLAGHGHKNTDPAVHHQAATPVYGDATPATGSAESTRVGCLDKLKAKTGVGHGLAPEQARAHGATPIHHGATAFPHEDNIATSHAMDPTGLGAGGNHIGRQENYSGAPMGAGYDQSDPRYSPDYNGGMNLHSSAAVHGGWPHPTNPNQTAGVGVYGEPHHSHMPGMANPNETGSGYGGPHPTNPTGVTNPQGGAVLGDHHGNVYEGPRDDNVKKEGFVSKIMDKLHSPKGKPAHTAATTTTTTPSAY